MEEYHCKVCEGKGEAVSHSIGAFGERETDRYRCPSCAGTGIDYKFLFDFMANNFGHISRDFGGDGFTMTIDGHAKNPVWAFIFTQNKKMKKEAKEYEEYLRLKEKFEK